MPVARSNDDPLVPIDTPRALDVQCVETDKDGYISTAHHFLDQEPLKRKMAFEMNDYHIDDPAVLVVNTISTLCQYFGKDFQ